MPPILLDTGVLVGWLDRRDPYHSRCVASLDRIRPPLVTCEAVLVECSILLRNIPGAIDSLLANLTAETFQLPFRLSESAEPVRAILRKYADTPADFADACLIQMADELGTGDILTLDSDFRQYRWRRNRRFNLLIPLD
ncbi:MAG TPA: PIN domain-containing protein [Terracidiphilus sp.]|nr:PIN domain-containing protein [Terracidiphilus sp.]